MQRILLVEDSKETQDLVLHILGRDFLVDVATSLSEAFQRLQERRFDLLLLDLGLPDGTGFDLCKRIIQDSAYELPVVILSARTEVPDKVMGFYLGIEDYIEKPFNPIEFRARVESRLKKTAFKKNTGQIFRVGSLEFDLNNHRLNVVEGENRKSVDLTSIEFKILLTLAKKPGNVFSRNDLIQSVWFDSTNIVERGIDTHISHIRKKLGTLSRVIHSAYGAGYRFNHAP